MTEKIANFVLPSPDGTLFYVKSDNPAIFRMGKSGLNEELVYKPQDDSLLSIPLLLFPGGKDLLAVAFKRNLPNGRILRISLTSHEAVDLGEMPVGSGVVAWAEPGNSMLFSHTVNGLINIWKYSLQDRSLTQITFGTGADFSPMPDPGGKGIYFVNGKSSGFLTVYHVKSKESRDIVSEDATQPIISPDGKLLMYITKPGPQTDELWVSGIDGGNKLKLATGESLSLDTGTWASDNFHRSFWERVSGANDKGYIVGADGSGLRQLPRSGVNVQAMVWSSDRKSVYVSAAEKGGTIPTVWKWSVEGSNPEKFLDNCCMLWGAVPGGQYLLGVVFSMRKDWNLRGLHLR